MRAMLSSSLCCHKEQVRLESAQHWIPALSSCLSALARGTARERRASAGADADAAERGGQALLMKPGSRRCACLSTASVPYIMAVSDFITGIASGM